MNELYDVIRFAYVSGYKSWTKPFHRPTHRTIITLMLLPCGDVELNLGLVNKSIYPCGFCELRVNWSHKACDSCSLWCHKTCLSMASGDFAHLENESNTSWHCIKCRTPLSDTYHAYDIPVNNMFDTLASIPGNDSVFNGSTVSASSPSAPLRHNSPYSTCGSHKSSRNDSVTQGPPPKKSNNLRLCIFNCSSARNRRAELEYMAEYMKPDIIFITETKITSDIKYCEFLPDNYSGTIREDRAKDGGGVMIATRKDLHVVEIDLCENTAECVWAKILIRGQDPILAGSFYETNSEHTINQMEELEKTLNHVQETHNPNGKYTVMLGGDFSVPYIGWETLAILPSCNNRGMYEKLFVVIDENELQQLQLEHTRNDATLDLFFTNKNITVIPGISDHDTVVVNTALTITPNVKLPCKIWQWLKTDWDKVKEEFTTYRDTYFHKARNHSVDENCKSFQDFIMGIINKYVPCKMSSTRRNVPWCTPAIKRMCRKKQRLYSKCKRTHRPRDWEAFKSHQRATLSALRSARWSYIGGMLSDSEETGNSKPFWRYVKSQRQDNCGVSPLKHDGELHSDSQSKADILNHQFSSVFTTDDVHADTVLEGSSIPPVANLKICEKGVAKLLCEVDPSKAGGPDELPCRILRELAEDIAPILTDIYTQSLSSRELPSTWKSAYNSPIFKKGAICEAENYRPVSLTCIPCKTLEHIICSHLRSHLDKYGALSPYNHGFRKYHSCDTHLILTIQDLLIRKDAVKS